MNQLTLDHWAARQTDPITSHLASYSTPARVTDRDRALAALRKAGPDGLTDHELGDAIGRAQTSAGKRRHELMVLGLVVNTGRTRPSPWGSPCIVWAVAE